MTNQEILTYLNQNRLMNIDMIEAIRRGRAEVLYAAPDAVLLFTRGWLHLLACDTLEAGKAALAHCKQPLDGIVAHSPVARDAVWTAHPEYRAHCNACWQGMYTKKTLLPVEPTCEIRPFPKDRIPFILTHYGTVNDPRYFEERIESGEMFAAYVRENLVGFIGFHDDGSMGMLEVLPEYRHLHIGSALESYLLNESLLRGWTPYCQIFVGNIPSVRLQRRLGLIVSEEELYWMHGERE